MPVDSNQHLGQRIAIIGWSSTGKSTLAIRLGRNLGLPVTHLDRLRFKPNSNWKKYPHSKFIKEHNDVISDNIWIIEGSYSGLMLQRFERATAIIQIKQNRFGALYRYIKRYFNTRLRTGAPKGLKETFDWNMVWWIIQPQFLYPDRRRKNKLRARLLKQHKDKLIVLRSFREIDQLVQSVRHTENEQS